MKTTRRISVLFLAIVMALSLAACGGGSQSTVVLRGDLTSAMGGVPTTDTWTLTAESDIVQTLKEVLEYDLSAFDDATKDEFDDMIESVLLEPANRISGITCTSRTSGGTYIIELTVDCTGKAVEEAVAAEILQVQGEANKISLKQTQSALEGQGYKVVE